MKLVRSFFCCWAGGWEVDGTKFFSELLDFRIWNLSCPHPLPQTQLSKWHTDRSILLLQATFLLPDRTFRRETCLKLLKRHTCHSKAPCPKPLFWIVMLLNVWWPFDIVPPTSGYHEQRFLETCACVFLLCFWKDLQPANIWPRWTSSPELRVENANICRSYSGQLV